MSQSLIDHPNFDPSDEESVSRREGTIAGPVVGCVLLLSTHPSCGALGGINASAAWTLGLLGWMAVWWMTQAVPLAVTSLLPILFLPLLEIGTFRDNATHYADSIIFLFAGAGVIGIALQRHGVSARFTHGVLRVAGTSSIGVVTGLFVATMSLSAFMSNAAVTAMMLPLAMGIIAAAKPLPSVTAEQGQRGMRNVAMVCLLVVAYASTVGGVTTVIGSPPNGIAAKYLADSGSPVEFMEWARFGTPVAILFAPIAITTMLWLFPLKAISFEGIQSNAVVRFSPAAWITLAVFLLTILVWMTAPAWATGWRPKYLTDGAVAIGAAVLLFTVPASIRPWRPVLSWKVTQGLPWGVYILFGGGLALADAMQRTGLSQAIGESFSGLGAMPSLVVLGVVVTVLVFASEIASNTALTATAVPILGALAPQLGIPVERLVIAAAFAASYAFMLPVGTPPNAMVFATGLIPSTAMMRVGLCLNVMAIIVITLMSQWLL